MRGVARSASNGVLILAAFALASAAPAQKAVEGKATAELLQQLLRYDSSNVPGDTRGVATHLKRIFDAAGIPNETIVAPNGLAAHFVARLKGDGSKRPLLLAAHSDVVPAERGGWTVDPFGGVAKDGYLWGRGAIDNKGAVAAFTRAMLRLKSSGAHLTRDVIFLAEADEEQGSFGTSWLAETHWDKIDAEFALNEGGLVLAKDGRVTQVNVSYADKLSVTVRIRTHGRTSHSSRPLPIDLTANGQLITALDKLQHYSAPVEMTPETRDYFTKLGKLSQGPLKRAIDELLAASDAAARNSAAGKIVALGESGWGMEGLLHNTLVTMTITAGFKANAMPNEAEAVLNARLLPGVDVEEFIEALRLVIDNPRVDVEIVSTLPKAEVLPYFKMRSNIKASTIDTDLYRAIVRSAAVTWPQAPVLPTLLVAGTDAVPWRRRSIPVYGIAPFPIEPVDQARIHSNDERINLGGIDSGSEFVYRIVVDVATR